MKYSIFAALLLGSAFTSVHAASVSGQGTWETTLQARDLDGNLTTAEAWYDEVLGITWLADANYAQTSGHDADGLMTWATAMSWAANLDPYNSGITGWRLPDTDPVDGSVYDYDAKYDGSSDRGYNISAPGTVHAGSTGSEMAHLFYNTLRNLAYYDTSGSGPQTGWSLTNTGPFDNVESYNYWSATEYAPNTLRAWHFGVGFGGQRDGGKIDDRYAWAVHLGDVGATVVPIPAAAWLFGSAIIGAGMYGRRKKKAA